jgi:hypothetical protein
MANTQTISLFLLNLENGNTISDFRRAIRQHGANPLEEYKAGDAGAESSSRIGVPIPAARPRFAGTSGYCPSKVQNDH